MTRFLHPASRRFLAGRAHAILECTQKTKNVRQDVSLSPGSDPAVELVVSCLSCPPDLICKENVEWLWISGSSVLGASRKNCLHRVAVRRCKDLW